MWHSVRIERLETLGVEPEFFHLPRSVDGLDAVDYYLIKAAPAEAVRLRDRWDILAVGTILSHPQEVVLRQLRIYQEFLEEPSDFNGWTDGTGLQSFNPPELQAFRDFLIARADQVLTPEVQVDAHSYFLPASAADYEACGIPKGLLDRFALLFRETDVYRYQPDVTIPPRDVCCFLGISYWTSSTHPISSTLYVALETYTAERIAAIQHDWATYVRNQSVNPMLDVRMMKAESTLRFSRGALLALAGLLEERLQSITSGSRA